MTCRSLQVNSQEEWQNASQWLKDRAKSSSEVEAKVSEIIARVQNEGDAALIAYTSQFDCHDFKSPLCLTEHEISLAAASIPPEDRDRIYRAADNIRAFHENQKGYGKSPRHVRFH